ncbi:MAG: sigma factor-like helix-turn-helix DNA-binding protein [Bdellovibrionales bacterium]
MVASVIETVAKYFYFLSQDENVTHAISFRVFEDLRRHDWLEPGQKNHWIEVLHKWKGRLPRFHARPWRDQPREPAFQTPRDFDSLAWRKFLQSGDPGEVEAVLLSRILLFSDDEIAAGLGVSIGTVRYRVGRGLRHLGGYLET